MRALLLLCTVVCMAGVAAAQSATAPPAATSAAPFYPNLEPAPNGALAIPETAIESNKSGVAFLCCTAKADRGLDCRVGSESPQNYGFGDAAMHFSHAAHLTADSYAALQARPGRQFALSLHFRALPVTANEDQTAEQARAGAADLCGAGTGPAPQFIAISGQRNERAPGAPGEQHGHHSHTLGH